MKTLFTSDHAAWLFLASFLVLGTGLYFTLPWCAAFGVGLMFTSFDVLGWKWCMFGERRVNADGQERWIRNIKTGPGVIPAYRLFQHGLFIPILALVWTYCGWQAAIAPIILWQSFALDVAYHWIAKATLAAWTRDDYYGYGYWAGPVGWYYWLDGWLHARKPRAMYAGALYLQAIAGMIVATALVVFA